MRGRGEVGSAVIAGVAVAALAMVLFLPAGPATAQQTQEAAAGVFGESVDVKVVNVEVVVTDRDGQRVTGLSPDDFRLVVDGREVPIDYFTEVRGGEAITQEVGKAVPSVGAVEAGEPVGTSYLVYVDDYFSVTTHRNRVLRALSEELALLGPADRVAVVAFDGRELEMLSSWSSSPSELGKALERAATRRSYGVERLAELRSLGVAGLGTRIYDLELEQQLESSVRAAALALRGFARPPGRKVMLLLSGGWPFATGLADDGYAGHRSLPRFNRISRDGWEMFGPLADTANRLGYTIYGVDVPGLEGGLSTVDASRRTALPDRLRRHEQAIHETLDFLAEETGGRSLLNGRREAALAAVHADTRSYYWLGFTPEGPGDDRRHRIEVEVRRRGLEARARESFLDFSRSAEVTAMTESALLFGAPPAAAALAVDLGAPRRAGRRVEVPLALTIPAEAVTVVPVDGRWVAELELRVAVVDERGDRADVPVIPLRLTLEEAPTPGQALAYETTLLLRRRAHDLVVTVFDPLSGALLSSREQVAPPG